MSTHPEGFTQRGPLPHAVTNPAPFVPLVPLENPRAPDFSAAAALQKKIEEAEQRVQRRDAEHADARAQLRAAQDHRAAFPDSEDARGRLVQARAAEQAAADDLDAAKVALDGARQRLADAQASGQLDDFGRADQAQGVDAFRAAMAPLIERATQAGRDLAAIVADARALVDRMGVARHRAITTARELGVTYRPTSLDIDDAMRGVGQAFRAGFTQGGQRDGELSGWTRGA